MQTLYFFILAVFPAGMIYHIIRHTLKSCSVPLFSNLIGPERNSKVAVLAFPPKPDYTCIRLYV